MTESRRITLDLVSRALEYPDEKFFQAMPLMAEDARENLNIREQAIYLEFLESLQRLGLTRAQENYVATFDHDPDASLYLAWHRYGNDRGQGRALGALNGLYRACGMEPEPGAMPDWLPRMLEFMAQAEEWAIETMLDGFGPELDRLVNHVRETAQPYANLLGLAIEPLKEKWPDRFKPRNTPDPTLRPMATAEPEFIEPIPQPLPGFNSNIFGNKL